MSDMSEREGCVKLGLGVAGGLLAIGLSIFASRNVESQGGKIDTLLNDLKAEQSETTNLTSAKLPGAFRALVVQTKNYVINFIPSAEEDPNGILLIFYKSSSDGEEYAKVSSTGKVLEGSATVANGGLEQLRKKYPDALDGVPKAVERVVNSNY